MDHDTRAFSPGQYEYPMLILPKTCSSLEINTDPTKNLFIEVKITSPNSEGQIACLYEGQCIVKLVENYYDLRLHTMSPPEDNEIEGLPAILDQQQQSEELLYRNYIWNNSSSSMHGNSYNTDQSWQYPVSYQTHSNNIRVEHHSTYITQNVYNFNNAAAHYAPHETFGIQKHHEMQPVNGSITIPNPLVNFEDEIDRSVRGIANNADDSGIADVSRNEALRSLRQLMPPDMERLPTQHTIILFSGPDERRGQTIQQIGYDDPTVTCCTVPMEVDNEVVIDSLEPIPLNQKMYQCANCEQIFDQLSKLREHRNKHARANYDERSPSDRTIKYVCTINNCGKKLTCRDKFVQHNLAHGDPDLECPKCGNVFASKQTLKVHLKIHDRKYPCKFCIRSYTDLESLEGHLAKSHSRLQCEYCSYHANTNGDLLAHQKIHKAVYTFDGDGENDSNKEYNFNDNNVESIESLSKVRDWICDNYDENQVSHESTEAGFVLNVENIDEPSTFINEEKRYYQLQNITNTEDTHLIAQDKQIEIECCFENHPSNKNNDIVIAESQKIICEDSTQNRSQPQFNESQHDSTETKGNENHFDIKGDESKFDDKGSLIDAKGRLIDDKESKFDEKRSLFDDKGSRIDDKGSLIDHKGSNFDEKVSQIDEKGSNFDKNGSQFDENGSQFDDFGSQYDNESSFDMEDDPDDEDFNISIDEGSNHSQSDQNIDLIMNKEIPNEVFYTLQSKSSRKLNKVCVICEKKFNRNSDMKRHLIEHVIRCTLAQLPVSQSGILNIECEVCHKATFSKVDQYKEHLRVHAKLTLYRCTFCDKSFSDSSNFCKHKKVHGSTYFQCDLCKRKFNSKQMITRHLEYHEQNAPLPCPICGDKFHFKSTLNKHVKNYHSERATSRFRCKFCFKQFGTLKSKWDHEWNTHNIRKMIIDCLVCGAKFRKYSELKRHCSEEHNVAIPTVKDLLIDKLKQN